MECNDGFILASSACELKNQTIWKEHFLYKKNNVPSPSVSPICNPVINQNISIDLGFNTIGGVSAIVVSSFSNVSMGIFFIKIASISSPNALSQPKITSNSYGFSPNQYTVINYGISNCNKQNITWSLYLYENNSNSFNL
jgi:hypothetical protein